MHYKHQLLLTFGIVCLLGGSLASCDSPPGSVDRSRSYPIVESLHLDPDSILFSNRDGMHDTTVTINLLASVTAALPPDSTPRYSIQMENGDVVLEGRMAPALSTGELLFGRTVNLQLNTADFATYRVYAYTFNEAGQGNWVQSNLVIRGVAANPPQLLDVSNPDTVVIPPSGQTRNIVFTAKTSDPDGLQNIAFVRMKLFNSGTTTNPIGQFDLQDDGDATGSGDSTAGDSVYTKTLSINSGNSPADYDVYYFALDKAGLSSDTTKTTLSIVH